MKQLSDGQRCRVAFAWLAWQVSSSYTIASIVGEGY